MKRSKWTKDIVMYLNAEKPYKIMNDIQKAIFKLTISVIKTKKVGQMYSDSEIRQGFQKQLKPLLEEVAEKAYYAGLARSYSDFKSWKKDNLTFNE